MGLVEGAEMATQINGTNVMETIPRFPPMFEFGSWGYLHTCGRDSIPVATWPQALREEWAVTPKSTPWGLASRKGWVRKNEDAPDEYTGPMKGCVLEFSQVLPGFEPCPWGEDFSAVQMTCWDDKGRHWAYGPSNSLCAAVAVDFEDGTVRFSHGPEVGTYRLNGELIGWEDNSPAEN